MTDRAKWICIALALVSLPSISSAHLKVCSRQEAREAEAIAASRSSWDELYFAFQKYGHCDDGAIGEGFSESVSVLMAEEWQTMVRLAKLAKKDSAFRMFVIKHLDETVPIDRLEKIKINAESKCGKATQGMCLEIRQSLGKIGLR